MANPVIYPGDLKFHEVRINGTDVTEFTVLTYIFQDIFTPFWSAQIGLADSQNLVMNLPITPGSKVEIVIETDAPKPCTGRKKFTFYVYKVSDREIEKQETYTYTLHCVTKEFFENEKARIQKAFKRMAPQDIASEAVGYMGGGMSKMDNDPTKYDLIVPNWSPVATVEWLSKIAKVPNGGADFVFYQSDIGSFKFRSIEKMFKDRSGLELRQVNPNIREANGNENENAFVNVESFEFIVHHDAVRNFQTGYYANSVLTHDIVNKTVTTTPFHYGDDIKADAQKKPFKGPQFEGAELSNLSFYPRHPGIMDGITPGDTHTDWLGSRKTNQTKLEENRLIVQVPGFVCGWEWLGKQCYIELPSHQDLNEDKIYDEYFKGDYLITAIKHVVTFGKYQTVMELAKKRLEKPYQTTS
jgi:hypothetical protein